jgi:hypothetical protein
MLYDWYDIKRRKIQNVGHSDAGNGNLDENYCVIQ